MTTLNALKSAINQSSLFGAIALVTLVPVIMPHTVFAAEQTVGQSQIFEIKDLKLQKQTATVQTVENPNALSIDEVQSNDPLTKKLQEYFEKYDSPFAQYASEIPKVELWQKSLAISWVESNFCKKAMNKNCSSIGVAPGHKLWRKYDTELDWLKDMSKLMQKPIYSEKYNTFEKMRGVYVVPGSAAWVNGATQKYNDFMKMTEEAETEVRQTAQINSDSENLHTFPEIALAK